MLRALVRSTGMKAWKSEGSGDVGQVPPNTAGYATCSHNAAQPPDECPCSNRPLGLRSIRYLRSSAGISSFTSASPHGPLLAEFANSCVPNGQDWYARVCELGQ